MITFATKELIMLSFPRVIYVYDAHCGWCFGFKEAFMEFYSEYQESFEFEVLSGNMIPLERKQHIGQMADYILNAYHRVEELSGCKFGEGYLEHLRNPTNSSLEICSEKPGIALSVYKMKNPHDAPYFAAALQNLIMVDGKDLELDKTYLDLANSFDLNGPEFVSEMKTEQARDMAHQEFAMVKQLGITGFPCVLVQTDERKLYMIARGYTSFEDLKERFDKVIEEFRIANN
ncbi:MAG: hypothetical protein R2809_11755 [Flavobacteriales bacterium]